MIGRYKFLIPQRGGRVSVNSRSIRQNHYGFYPELLDYLDTRHNEGDFIVNLAQVGECDSSCVASLIGLLQATQKKGIKLVLEDVPEKMKHHIKIANTGAFFNFRDSS